MVKFNLEKALSAQDKVATDFNDLGATKDNASNALDLGAIRKNMDIDPKDVEALKIAQEAIEKQTKI